jgi:drug/metabolite transporter (DMT)-like permease
MFALMCAIWGATWIAMKLGLATVPPVLFAGTRFLAAGLLMLGIVAATGGRARIAARDLPRLAAASALMVAAAYALLFWGARFVSSGVAAVLDMALIPVSLLAIGALLGEERLDRRRAVAIATGVAGLAILFGPKASATGAPGEAAGAAAIAASAVLYGLGSVLARPLLRRYAPLHLSGMTTLLGGAMLLAGSLPLEPGAVEALDLRWGAAAWAGWAFLVLFGSLCAYTIYMRLLRDWGPSRAGTYAFVSPVLAALMGMAAFGETLGASDALGMAVMLGAAWLALREPGPAPRAARPAATAG